MEKRKNDNKTPIDFVGGTDMHYVSYEKLSKKEKRRFDLQRRGSWNGVCPVTRRADSITASHIFKTQAQRSSDNAQNRLRKRL